MSQHVVRSFPLAAEYSKPTGVTPADVARLRGWLRTQPHLPEQHITDLDLVLCLHCCGRLPEAAQQLLDTHYTMKTAFTTIFKDRVVDDKIGLCLKRILLKPLPTRTKDGDAVLYAAILDTDVRNYMFVESLRAITMLIDLWQYEEGTWPGLVILYDLGGLRFGHIFKLEMETVRQFLTFMEEATFLKIKGIHLLNAPYFTDYFIALVKRFVRSELLDVFTVHQKRANTLDKFIDVTMLPAEAGGGYNTFEQCREETYQKMMANNEFFTMENKKRVNECLRPAAPREIASDSAKKLPKKCNIDS